MAQLGTMNYASHGTRLDMKIRSDENGRRRSSYTRLSSRQTSKSSLHPTLVSTSMIVAAAIAVPFILCILIYINLTWLQLFWLEVVPSLWSFLCSIFTPTNLFIVLNVLILSIFALAQLQNRTASTPALPPPRQSIANDNRYSSCDHDRPIDAYSHDVYSAESTKLIRIKRDEVSSADGDLQDNVQHNGSAILLGRSVAQDAIAMKDDGNADYYADEYAESTGAICVNHALNVQINGGEIQDETDSAMQLQVISVNSGAGAGDQLAELVIGTESGAHQEYVPQLSAIDCKSMQVHHCSSDFAHEEELLDAAPIMKAGGKAAASTESAAGVDDAFIDSLLADRKVSIFTRAQESSRPLASARFTRKKLGPPPNDRPLSPLRTILKRGDTLEATWKAICESKRHSSPFNRQHHPKHSTPNEGVSTKPRGPSSSLLSPIKQRSKAPRNINMLHDDELARPRSLLIRRREPSMPQEELNAKVESFISRFNAQIRIQREKSLLDFMEMVGRGAS